MRTPLVILGLGACAAPAGVPPTTTTTTTTTTVSTPTPTPTGTEPVPFECTGSPAQDVLDAFWRAFDERYALFDIRLPGGDWALLGQAACDGLDATTDDDALFDALITLARNLDDGHVNLVAPNLNRAEDAWVSAYPHYQELYRLELNAQRNYLDAPLTWAARDWFAWGRIGDVGYVSITSMDGLSPSGSEAADRAAAADAMAAVLADLGGITSLVVDIRANEGGWDAVALDIAAHFVGPQTLAWSEQRRDGPAHDAFTDWHDVDVEASDGLAFAGPVVVLTSGGTFSAAETFVLAMRVRDQVRVLGEPTSGHFSDLAGGRLPNDWRYTLSAERYRAADGEIYEARGAPVDIPVPFDPVLLNDQGRDTMLEAALQAR